MKKENITLGNNYEFLEINKINYKKFEIYKIVLIQKMMMMMVFLLLVVFVENHLPRQLLPNANIIFAK